MVNWASIISLIIVLGLMVGGTIWFVLQTIKKRREESLLNQEDVMSEEKSEET